MLFQRDVKQMQGSDTDSLKSFGDSSDRCCSPEQKN